MSEVIKMALKIVSYMPDMFNFRHLVQYLDLVLKEEFIIKENHGLGMLKPLILPESIAGFVKDLFLIYIQQLMNIPKLVDL